MIIELHDDTPAGPGEPHGPAGPTHCGNIRVDYEYQAEMWVDELTTSEPKVMRIVVPALGREWLRDLVTRKFVEVTRREKPVPGPEPTSRTEEGVR